MERPPLPPPPSDTEWFHGDGGVRLFSSTRVPPGGVRGVVYFVLGPEISSAELYPAFCTAARAAGFVTALMHARGTGYSDGMRGDAPDHRLFLSDQRKGLERLHERFPQKPIFLMGHSAGGAFALDLAAHASPTPAGVVLVNPMYKMLASPGMGPGALDYVRYAANFLMRPAALTVDMNSNPAVISHPADRAEGEAMQRDPLTVRYFSMRYMFSQKKVMDACVKNAAAVDSPLLVIQGAHDALVDPRGTEEILAAAHNADKRKLVVATAGHGSSAVEMAVSEIVTWLLSHSQAADQDGTGQAPGG